jgi:tetratricopeptide (TPR) repeat protein
MKMKILVLTLTLCFSFVTPIYVYSSPQGLSIKAMDKLKINSDAQSAFLSKCEDRSTNIKEVKNAYKAYRKALSISTKANIICKKKWFNDFKEDFYEDMSKEQQKDLEAAYKAVIKGIKVQSKTFITSARAVYKLAKTDRSYYKVKKTTADYRIEKAKKRFNKTKEALKIINNQQTEAVNFLFLKKDAISKEDNIFTRVKNRTNEKFIRSGKK